MGRAIEAEFGPSQIRTFRVPANGGPIVEVDLLERELIAPSGPFAERSIAPTTEAIEIEPDPAASDATQPAEDAAPGQRRLGRA